MTPELVPRLKFGVKAEVVFGDKSDLLRAAESPIANADLPVDFSELNMEIFGEVKPECTGVVTAVILGMAKSKQVSMVSTGAQRWVRACWDTY